MMTELVFHRSKLIALSAIVLLALALLVVVQPGLPAGMVLQPQTSGSASGSQAAAAGAPADVDPADRKFTYENYRFYQGRATSADPLANVHPADRKFYSGAYGSSGRTAGSIQAADDFDYAQAADEAAARWQAMARYYEQHGLLTRDDFDYEAAADNSAARWLAMGKAYERMGLLNER